MRALIVVAVVAVGVLYSPAAPPTIPYCATDDGSGPLPCYWDAHRLGDGHGRSFIANPDGTTTYTED